MVVFSSVPCSAHPVLTPMPGDSETAARFGAVDAVVVKHLRKEFPVTPVKVAVADMCLRIPGGETFALLGENGAGKTTTINMLLGVFPPTSGTAAIGGHDIRDDLDAAHLVTGICPQHDVLWATLTCEETLLFYARLKGIPASEEKSHVATYVGRNGSTAGRRD